VIYCPEGGYRTQPRVSTLGTLKISDFALKGREADLIKLAPIVTKISVRNRDVLQLDLLSRCWDVRSAAPSGRVALGWQFPG
jgi:hypothetical protein